MKALVLLLAMFIVSGCQSIAPRPATTETLASKKKKDALFKSAVAVLSVNGFTVKVSDPMTGIIVTEPKTYEVKRGVMRVPHPFKTTIQLTVADNSLTSTYRYQCKYQDVKYTGYGAVAADPQYDDCYASDSEVNKILPEHEAKLKDMLSKII